MKKLWAKIVGLISRVYDLIIKFISVKGVLFGSMCYLAIVVHSEIAIWFAFISGVVFIGDRRLNKYLEMTLGSGLTKTKGTEYNDITDTGK